MTEIGFIGLGRLGSRVALNLLEAGYGLRVHNRTPDKAKPLVERGAVHAARPCDAVAPGGIVATLLWDDASVDAVVRSEGFLERLGAGGIHVSMSTVSPEGSKALAALHAQHGSQLVEAPIFGVPEAATARKLWIPFAGPRAAKVRVRPVLEAMGAQGVFDFGEAIGAATTVKLVGNLLIISAATSLAEGLALVANSGFDQAAVVDMLTTTLFAGQIYQSYGKMVVDGGMGRLAGSAIPGKDLNLFKAAAEAANAPTAVANLLLNLRGG